MKTLLVCGGRDFHDDRVLFAGMKRAVAALGAKGPADLRVIHGGARGADLLAGRIARKVGILVVVFPARWDLYGKAAGFRRNRQMLEEGHPDLVLAAPGGRGTEDMVRQATAAGVPVLRA